ncbi:hypothetical protein BCR33DRAFT_580841 [Rhizoclosmatium globosum]|uniref:Zn(2)-C6 fungal-type domain-containing protein n=1 Tax=Rhizoclosmatium globosum TaxID=329046 RepID=A0A1Y2CR89_9FUNG|nr:hypothetical protein BCR33DRAFT_580841 [Rhizoclosmatium globosum]|eukprot:ORY49354.1 hypothetical protein BCR33DRAFT_580841 [Rhizoclosmatium globosum]
MPPGPRPSSCLRCRKDRKRCIRLESASCERCLTLGPSVECRFPPSKTDSSENEEVAVVRLSSESSGNQAQESSASPPHGQLQSPVVLAQIMHAFEDPFTAIKHQEARTSSEVEDIDLIGTFADYILLQRFYSEASESQMILMSIDIFGFLKNFFREPAPLRLVLGAIAARFVKPPVPEEVSFSYYRRARKAVMRVADEPSLRTVKHFTGLEGSPSGRDNLN